MKILDFVNQVVARIGRFFLPAQPEFSFNREPFSVPVEKKKRVPREDLRASKESLADLLDDLDITFDAVKLPTDKASWLTNDTAIGLKRMGVYVPHPCTMRFRRDPNDIRVDLDGTFPAMMALSLSNSNVFDGTYYHPTMLFAIKQRKLPPYVSQAPGIVYQFGFSIKYGGKNCWMSCHLVIDSKSGAITVCDELRKKVHKIPVKKDRRSHERIKEFSTRSWQPPAMISVDVPTTLDEQRLWFMNAFAGMLHWWQARASRWNVAVKKGKDRVTFSIEPGNTKTYFADRDKSVRTASGQMKKIIHYVSGHERQTATKTVQVREHIRGMREFDWGKYHCIVTAPAFHLTQLSSEFDVAAYDESLKGETVGAGAIGRVLAELEDSDNRRHSRCAPSGGT